MAMQQRLETLMNILSRERYRSVSDLAVDLDVSEMTIRRYLERLESQNLVHRTHGGAFAGQEMIEVDYRFRETVMQDEKAAIGRAAYTIVQPGESIYIDAGSTTAFLAMCIDGSKRVTVVTHSLVVAQALEQRENVETILLGGKVHGATHSLIGPLTEESIKRFNFNRCFLGTSGINIRKGLTQSTFDEVPIKRAAAENSKEVIVLADSSKINREVLVLFLEISRVNILITDIGIGRQEKYDLEEQGVRVVVVGQ
jgi:DeoR/GlpR family transcriptional regulator of sugar metabolism